MEGHKLPKDPKSDTPRSFQLDCLFIHLPGNTSCAPSVEQDQALNRSSLDVVHAIYFWGVTGRNCKGWPTWREHREMKLNPHFHSACFASPSFFAQHLVWILILERFLSPWKVCGLQVYWGYLLLSDKAKATEDASFGLLLLCHTPAVPHWWDWAQTHLMCTCSAL